ncbi:hypothetical protein [Nocardioides sp. AE5]|uniref:sugar ABC transporter substrate-binding protein n=1 Tax=Nocardioides sp. AE5 TaxID=2962573 RepID=UPI0028825A12|nr:hypothetical protein [Nocardioides sp. AE5]MDT0203054.1 hypothetical protein [Nocardioides sp. AE5]
MYEEISPLLERPTSIGLVEPAESVPADMELIFLQCPLPSCEALAQALKAAIDEVGWNLRIISTGGTPEEIKSAWAQAVRLAPDGVIGITHDRLYFESELQQLKAKDIPVLRLNVTDPAGNGVTGNILGRDAYEAAGMTIAKYALSRAGEDLNAVAFTVGEVIPSLQVMAESYKKTVEANCDSCTVEVVELPSTSIGKDFPSRIASHLRRNPDVNWVEIGLSDFMVGLPAALRSAGITPDQVQFMGLGAYNTAANGYLAEDDFLTAVLTAASDEQMWRAVDFFIREFNGQDSSVSTDLSTWPTWIVTSETLPSSTETFPTVADFKEQYRALWGLAN